MKKTRILALSLIVMIMLVGAGYAAWTDTLKITNTVKTGEMNVEFVDADFDGTRLAPIVTGLEVGGNYLIPTIHLDDPKNITVRVENMYPGTGILYDAVLKNKGTVPAVIDNVQVIFNTDNQKLRDNLIVVGGYIHMRPGTGEVDGDIFPGFWDAISGRKIKLNDLQKNLNDMLKNTTMQPGDYIVFDIPDEFKDEIQTALTEEEISGYDPQTQNCIIMGLPKKAGNDLKEQEAVFTIKVNFKQHNK